MPPGSPIIHLPYQVSRSWLADEYRAGRLPDTHHVFPLDLDELDEPLRTHADIVAASVWQGNRHGHVYVHGTGIDETRIVYEEADNLPPRYPGDPIDAKIGSCPELDKPTDDPHAIIDAYEAWIGAYRLLAPDALKEWAQAKAEQASENGVEPDDISIFISHVEFQRPGDPNPLTLELYLARHPDAFRAARSAEIYEFHMMASLPPSSVRAAKHIAGPHPVMPSSPEVLAMAEAYEEWAEKVHGMARYHHFAARKKATSFEDGMRRWAKRHGSDRLQIGLADGYRMTRVYLEERIRREIPGFYAASEEKNKPLPLKPRSAPSEAALRMRRWVQARLEEYAEPGAPIPKADIAWMNDDDIPAQMWPDAQEYHDDYRDEDGFEVIVVPDWLNRYKLIAGVMSDESQPPDNFPYVLGPADYDPEHDPERSSLPGGYTPPSDILVDASDFAPSPPAGSPGGGFAPAPTGDDDIPF